MSSIFLLPTSERLRLDERIRLDVDELLELRLADPTFARGVSLGEEVRLDLRNLLSLSASTRFATSSAN